MNHKLHDAHGSAPAIDPEKEKKVAEACKAVGFTTSLTGSHFERINRDFQRAAKDLQRFSGLDVEAARELLKSEKITGRQPPQRTLRRKIRRAAGGAAGLAFYGAVVGVFLAANPGLFDDLRTFDAIVLIAYAGLCAAAGVLAVVSLERA